MAGRRDRQGLQSVQDARAALRLAQETMRHAQEAVEHAMRGVKTREENLRSVAVRTRVDPALLLV